MKAESRLEAAPRKSTKYSIHPVYPILIGIGLLIGGLSSLHEILDPSYDAFMYPHFPRVLPWYLFGYGWYKFLSLCYSVEVHNDYFKLRSLTRTRVLRFEDIYDITDKHGFVTITHTGGKAHVTELIDGVSNIISVFRRVPVPQKKSSPEPKYNRSWSLIIKIICGFGLLFYAIYVESVRSGLR